jgi:hypothetical protein
VEVAGVARVVRSGPPPAVQSEPPPAMHSEPPRVVHSAPRLVHLAPRLVHSAPSRTVRNPRAVPRARSPDAAGIVLPLQATKPWRTMQRHAVSSVHLREVLSIPRPWTFSLQALRYLVNQTSLRKSCRSRAEGARKLASCGIELAVHYLTPLVPFIWSLVPSFGSSTWDRFLLTPGPVLVMFESERDTRNGAKVPSAR